MDVVKFVGTVVNFEDNLRLEYFRDIYKNKFLIVVNMIFKGSIFRVLNNVLIFVILDLLFNFVVFG